MNVKFDKISFCFPEKKNWKSQFTGAKGITSASGNVWFLFSFWRPNKQKSLKLPFLMHTHNLLSPKREHRTHKSHFQAQINIMTQKACTYRNMRERERANQDWRPEWGPAGSEGIWWSPLSHRTTPFFFLFLWLCFSLCLSVTTHRLVFLLLLLILSGELLYALHCLYPTTSLSAKAVFLFFCFF